RKNLTYRKPDIEPEEIARICKAIGLEPVLERLSDGLETRLSEGGANLSHGERQHISLARAMVGEPEIVVIDSPHIQSNRALKDAVRELMNSYPGTVIVVTEDEDLVDCATTIWALGGPQPDASRQTTSLRTVASAG